ncbi:class F sortase [Streptomyces sp. NPDC053048]|uniref:class F sortase n=1 Tax=Streptomyces sp. NPDC053048 TaxID=3365694 RepID=UPI0037D1A402
MSEKRTGGVSRLLTGVAWAALMLALWLVGNDTVEEPIAKAPKTGDVAAEGRPPALGLPPAHQPVPGAGPQGLIIKAMGLQAPIEGHGLDQLGGVEPPPYERPNAVAWYQDGPRPGSAGAAVLVGHVDTKRSPAVFYELSNIRRGTKITVVRTDGTTAEFTVENIAVVENDKFDVDKVYGPADTKRAELRLITCGGDYDRAQREYKANVVVSAYLTGTGRAAPGTFSPGNGNSNGNSNSNGSDSGNESGTGSGGDSGSDNGSGSESEATERSGRDTAQS